MYKEPWYLFAETHAAKEWKFGNRSIWVCRMNVKDLVANTWQKINSLPRWRGLSVFIPTMKLLNICASGSNISSITSNKARSNTSCRKHRLLKSRILKTAQHWNANSSSTWAPNMALGFTARQTVAGSICSEYNHPRISNTQQKAFPTSWFWSEFVPVGCTYCQ